MRICEPVSSSGSSLTELDLDVGNSKSTHRKTAAGGGSQADGYNVVSRHMSPLDIRFSKDKMRHLFSVGRRVADTVEQIKIVQCTKSEAMQYGASWKLGAPFPAIRVIAWCWRPKDRNPDDVRDSSGNLDALPALWFTLDNRRLYCLQEAALQTYPERCVVDVDMLLGPPSWITAGKQEFRKADGRGHGFDSTGTGKTIRIGSRTNGVSFIEWSWHAKVISGFSNTVLDNLKSIKEGESEHITMSKKLSWILRKRVCSSNIDMDSEGWVRLRDLVKLKFLSCPSTTKFLEVVKSANSHRLRYQLKTFPSRHDDFEVFIRAMSKPSASATLISSCSENVSHHGCASSVSSATKSPIPLECYRGATSGYGDWLPCPHVISTPSPQ